MAKPKNKYKYEKKKKSPEDTAYEKLKKDFAKIRAAKAKLNPPPPEVKPLSKFELAAKENEEYKQIIRGPNDNLATASAGKSTESPAKITKREQFLMDVYSKNSPQYHQLKKLTDNPVDNTPIDNHPLDFVTTCQNEHTVKPLINNPYAGSAKIQDISIKKKKEQ